MDKFRLVERLKHHDEVVAVTGDGTNDAAALKKADVGLAMGIAGTEVAKEASDIIILDDNFVSIVRSCMWGRNVYDNVRKFLQFQLTVNVVALVTAFVGAVSRYGTPLTAVQLLWVNLIMDTFAALALGTEKPTPDLLNRKPYGRNSSLVSRVMYRNIVGQSILQVCLRKQMISSGNSMTSNLTFFQILIVMVLLYKGVEIFGLDVSGNTTSDATVHYTLVFNVFVFLQIFNELNSRKVGVEMNVFKGFFDNYVFSAVLIFTIVIQILVVEFGGIFTNTVHLPLNLWVWSLVLGLLSIPFGFLLRMIPVQLEEFEKPTAESVSNELAFLVHREGNNEGGKPTSAQVAPGMVKLEV
jgi:magnesium-transporting ATPase (P-type)